MCRVHSWPRIGVVLGLLLVLSACTATSDQEESWQGVRRQPGASSAWQGQQSSVTERAEVVARTAGEWSSLWQKTGVAAPAALGSGEMGLALFLGTRGTTGYNVFLEEPRMSSGKRELQALFYETVPGPDREVKETPVSPFAVRIVERFDGPVKFVRASSAED
ncbi:PrcB_C domain-containing protein [Azospirillaceae bacterium]